MAFREQTYEARCDTCKEIATHACRRCNRPYCAAHRPAAVERCDSCEAEFEDRLEARELVLYQQDPLERVAGRMREGEPFVAGAAIAGVTFWFCMFTGVALDLCIFGAGVSGLVAGLISAGFRRQKRRRRERLEAKRLAFLTESKHASG